ncbi:GIY-YIG nuclease family protein [Candidatus Uhrbacteria bacterium]|nr:GIY-YIG nuclease family protein [Candidatus Uhrbacteria bacterium]
MFFVYLLQSEVDGTYYIGRTNDVSRRLDDHNSGQSFYTKRKRPWRLVYYEAYDNEDLAKEREKKLKKRGSSYYGLLERLGRK